MLICYFLLFHYFDLVMQTGISYMSVFYTLIFFHNIISNLIVFSMIPFIFYYIFLRFAYCMLGSVSLSYFFCNVNWIFTYVSLLHFEFFHNIISLFIVSVLISLCFVYIVMVNFLLLLVFFLNYHQVKIG